jgi:hypothetical protein
LDVIGTKVSRVFLLVIHRHIFSFVLTFMFLQTQATGKEKGGKPDRKPYPLAHGLRILTETFSLRTLKSMPRNLKVSVPS